MIADDEEDPYAAQADDAASEAEDAEFDRSLNAQTPEPTVAPPIEQTVSSPTAEQLYAPAQALADKPIPSDEELLTPQAPSKEGPSTAPPKGVQWAGDAFTIDQAPTAPSGKETPPPKGVQWAGDAFTLGEPSPEKPAEKPSFGFGDIWRGVQRGVVSTQQAIEGLANTVEQKLADWTGSEYLKHAAQSDKEVLARREAEAAKEFAPAVPNIDEAVKDPASFARYVFGKVGEAAPLLVQYTFGGVPRMVVLGALEGADRAAKENNGDPAATLTGATIGGTVAGLPAPFLHGAAGKGFLENVVRATLGMPVVTTAQALAEPLPKMAATGKYEAPTWAQVREAAASGAIVGAGMGAVGGYRAGGRTPEVPPIEGRTTGVDPDHQAALDEAARAKGPQPEQLQIAPPLRQLPPPSLENRPPLSDVISGGPPAPTPAPPPAPRTPEQLAMDVELPARAPPAPAAEPAARPPEQLELPGGAPQQLGLPRAAEAPPAAAAPLEQPVQQRLPLAEPTARQGELPVTESQQQRLPLTGEQPYTGRPTAPLAPEPQEITAARAAPEEPPIRPPLGPTPQGEPGWTVERDHTGPGHVVKNADGNVIAIGDTAEQAMQFARARSRDQTAASEESAARAADREAAAARQPGRLVKGEAPAVEPTTVVEKPATVGEQLKAKQAAKTAAPTYTLRQEGDTWFVDASYMRGAFKASPDPGSRLGEPKARAEEWIKAAKIHDAATAAAPKVTEKVAPAQTKGEQLKAKRAAEKARLAAEKTAAPARGQVHVAEPTLEEEAPARPGLTGLLRKRLSRMADEARAEAEGQEIRHEPEGAAAEETVEPAEKTRSPKTTNLPRIAEDLVGDILSGEKTHLEAHEEYGVEKTGRGSKRTYPEIADYIEDRVNAATDETGKHVPKIKTMPTDQAIMDRARQLQQRVNRRDPTLTPASRVAQERAINAALERNREVRERADELRGMVNELRGGTEESKAADLETLMEKLKRQTGQLERGEELEAPLGDSSGGVLQRFMDRARANTAVRRLFRAPEINRPLQDMIRRDGGGGLGSSVHDYLDAIINNSMARSVVPHAVELARQLKRILPPDVRMMTQETGRDLFGRKIKEGTAGSYSPALDTIFINSKLAGDDYAHLTNATVNTLHEGLHGGTYHYVEHLLDAEKGRTITPIEKRHLDAFRAIEKAVQEIRANPPRRLSDVEKLSLEYANKDLHELTTMLMTDPIVHDVVRGVDASPALRQQLNRLGYGVKPKASVWDAFKNVMSRVLRLSGATAQGDFLDHVMSPMTEIIEAAGAHRAAREPQIRERAETNQATQMIAKMAKDDAARDSPLALIPDARQREAVRPLDEHLQELDAPLMGRKTREAVERGWVGMLRKVDGALVKRGARKAMLEVAPRNAVVSHNEDVFRSRDPDAPNAKPLQNWRDADAGIWRSTQRWQEHYADRVKNLVRRMAGPDRMAIAELMNDVGYAKVHLGEKDVAADNPHIKSGTDEAKEMNRLNDVYNNLSASAQETYQGYKRYYRETYAIERKAEFESIVKKALPDITPAEKTALAEQMTTLKKINELIRAPDRTPLVDAFAERWQHNRALVREIAKRQRDGFVEGDYFPQKRYGDYVVTYGKKGVKTGPDAYGVEMFETSSAAAARRDELLAESDKLPEAQKFDVSEPFLKSATDTVRSNIPKELIDQLDAAIKQKGLSTDQAKVVQDAMLGLMLKNGANRHVSGMRRQGVKGAATEPEKTLLHDYTAFATRMGHLEHGGERATAMQEMERHLRRMREQGDGRVTTHVQAAAAQTELARLRQAKVAENDPRMMAQREILNRPAPSAEGDRARDVVDSLKARSAPLDGDMSSSFTGQAARKFNTLSAAYQLIRPAHFAVQVIDTHAKAEAYIGARHGFGATALALGKAVKDLAPRTALTGAKAMYRAVRNEMKIADWDMLNVHRQRLIEANPQNKAEINQLMDALDATGMAGHTHAREVQRMSRPGAFDFAGRTGSAISNLPGNLLNMANVAEHTVDVMNRVAVVKAAFDLEMRRSGRDVNRSIEYALEEGRKAMPDYTPGNKSPLTSQRGRLGQLAAPAMLYKQYGMHTYSVMANLVKNAATGKERAEAVKALAATLAFHSMLIGVLPSMFGVPVSAALGVWDWLNDKPGPHDYENDMKNSISDLSPIAAQFASRGLLGMAGVDLHRSLGLANMLNLTGPQTFDTKGWTAAAFATIAGAPGSQALEFLHPKGVTTFLPRVARDVVQGYQATQEGIKDPRGVSIIKQKDISPVDVGLKVLGFNPSPWAEPRGKREVLREYEQEIAADKKHAEEAYTRAYQAHDMSTAFKVLKAYNDMHPNARITSAQMASQMKGIAKRSNDPRFGGLDIPKKQQAEALRAVRGFGP